MPCHIHRINTFSSSSKPEICRESIKEIVCLIGQEKRKNIGTDRYKAIHNNYKLLLNTWTKAL